MKYNFLGTSDLQVSEIALGTMTYGEQNTPAEASAQLDYALSLGVNFIDAAEMYPVPGKADTQGRTEEYVGKWLLDQPRDKVIIFNQSDRSFAGIWLDTEWPALPEP